MKKTDSLNLTKQDIAGGKIASVSGTIVLRSIMGPVMDVFGARKGMFVLMAVCTPGVIGMIFTTNATGFIICRCLIGFSLATFVCSQTWCAQMFSRQIIGVANQVGARVTVRVNITVGVHACVGGSCVWGTSGVQG